MVRMTKETAERMLEEVPSGTQFYCADGKTMASLPELESALKEMSEDTFCYHSNESKSDFSNWVRDIIRDEKLARDLAKSLNRSQAQKKVGERIAFLASKVALDKP